MVIPHPSLAGKNVALIVGGPGSEREVSQASGRAVGAALARAGALVTEVDARDEGFVLPGETQLAFLMIHGTFGEDGHLQRELERRGVLYTGEGVEVSDRCFDKVKTKRAFAAAGVPTPEWEVIRAGERPTLGLPMVIKATREGSSVGVHLCRKEADIDPALADCARYGDEILVERLIEGLETTVGILGDQALPVILIKPPADGFYDFRNKYPFLSPGGHADHYCPAPFDEELTAIVQRAALQAVRALGVQVYCRVDIVLDDRARVAHVLEANTIPGMTEASLLPEAAAAAGIKMPELLGRIAELSAAARRT